MNTRYFKLYRAYSNSFNSSNVGNFFFWSWILNNCNKVQKKKKQVVVLCSRPRQNVKLKCTKKRDARAKLLFCQSKPIGCLPFSLPFQNARLLFPEKSFQRSWWNDEPIDPGSWPWESGRHPLFCSTAGP